MENKKVAARTIRRPQPFKEADPDNVSRFAARSKAITNRTELRSKTDKVAGDKFFYKNWGVKLLQTKFPQDRKYHYVEKMYPYSDLGELYFDEPQRPWEIEQCKDKAQVMKDAGLKYAYVTPLTSESEIYEQLGLLKGDANVVDSVS